MFMTALATTAKTLKHPQCLSVDEWIKKTYRYRYIHSGTSFSHREKKIVSCAVMQMNLKDSLLKEISQTKKICTIYLTFVESLKIVKFIKTE